MGVAFAIGALHMHDRDIRIERPHRPQRLFALKGRENRAEEMVSLSDIAAQRRARGKERNSHRAGFERQQQGQVGQVENFHAILFDGATKAVGRTHHHVSNPSRHDLLYTASAN